MTGAILGKFFRSWVGLDPRRIERLSLGNSVTFWHIARMGLLMRYIRLSRVTTGRSTWSRSWDDGLDGAALCHDLFGVCASAAHGPACVRFRCGPPRDAEGVVLQFVDHAYCHRS